MDSKHYNGRKISYIRYNFYPIWYNIIIYLMIFRILTITKFGGNEEEESIIVAKGVNLNMKGKLYEMVK